MGTTTLGIPYPELTDQPNGPTQMQAQANAVDALLQQRGIDMARMVARTGGYVIPDSTWSAINGWDAGTVYSSGGITYNGGGIFVLPAPGLWEWGLTTKWPSGMTTAHTRGYKVELNSSTVTGNYNGWTTDTYNNNGGGYIVTRSGRFYGNAGDQVQAWFVQTSGSAVTAIPSFFSLARLG